jgi:hypothetical protein
VEGGRDPAAGCPALQPHANRALPANGRTLTDDVEHLFLSVLTNGKVTDDKVEPHTDLLEEFPYVGPPHTATRTGGGSGDRLAM